MNSATWGEYWCSRCGKSYPTVERFYSLATWLLKHHVGPNACMGMNLVQIHEAYGSRLGG